MAEALLDHVVELALVFELAIYTLIFRIVIDVRNGQGNGKGDSFVDVVGVVIETVDKSPVILILEPEEKTVVAEHVQEQQGRQQYGGQSFQTSDSVLGNTSYALSARMQKMQITEKHPAKKADTPYQPLS